MKYRQLQYYRSFFHVYLNGSFAQSYIWEERGVFRVRRRLIDSRRSSLDIIADMLRTTYRGVKKTHLMNHCNMSYTQLEHYLSLILKKRLLMVENDGPNLLFRISDKGKNFLKSYKSLRALME